MSFIKIKTLKDKTISTRTERIQYDNCAPVRQVFDEFKEKCKTNYQIGEYCTVDEILEKFRGRCNT